MARFVETNDSREAIRNAALRTVLEVAENEDLARFRRESASLKRRLDVALRENRVLKRAAPAVFPPEGGVFFHERFDGSTLGDDCCFEFVGTCAGVGAGTPKWLRIPSADVFAAELRESVDVACEEDYLEWRVYRQITGAPVRELPDGGVLHAISCCLHGEEFPVPFEAFRYFPQGAMHNDPRCVAVPLRACCGFKVPSEEQAGRLAGWLFQPDTEGEPALAT